MYLIICTCSSTKIICNNEKLQQPTKILWYRIYLLLLFKGPLWLDEKVSSTTYCAGNVQQARSEHTKWPTHNYKCIKYYRTCSSTSLAPITLTPTNCLPIILYWSESAWTVRKIESTPTPPCMLLHLLLHFLTLMPSLANYLCDDALWNNLALLYTTGSDKINHKFTDAYIASSCGHPSYYMNSKIIFEQYRYM